MGEDWYVPSDNVHKSMWVRQGTREYRRLGIALGLIAFVSFANLYSSQAILSTFATDFHVSPASSALTLSISTLALTVFTPFISRLEKWISKTRLIGLSLLLSSVSLLVSAFSTTFVELVGMRGVMGIALAGAPALAMALVGERVSPSVRGTVMGLYIAGSSLGGLVGRIGSGLLTALAGWRFAIGTLAILGIVQALLFMRLTKTREGTRAITNSTSASMASELKGLWSTKGIKSSWLVGLFAMGSFVSMFNYIGFRLEAPPFYLSRTLISWIFIIYIFGMFSSAYMGRQIDRVGRSKILLISIGFMFFGAVLTFPDNLGLILLGLVFFIIGFFGTHTVASGWTAELSHGLASLSSSMYISFYYLGSSVMGYLFGFVWTYFRWNGVAELLSLAALILLGLWWSLASSTGSKPVGEVNL